LPGFVWPCAQIIVCRRQAELRLPATTRSKTRGLRSGYGAGGVLLSVPGYSLVPGGIRRAVAAIATVGWRSANSPHREGDHGACTLGRFSGTVRPRHGARPPGWLAAHVPQPTVDRRSQSHQGHTDRTSTPASPEPWPCLLEPFDVRFLGRIFPFVPGNVSFGYRLQHGFRSSAMLGSSTPLKVSAASFF